MATKARKPQAARKKERATRSAKPAGNDTRTANKGAYKGGRGGRYVYDLYDLKRIAAGAQGGYADTRAVVIEGENVQVGLAFEKRGCGSEPHTHPNEQFNFIVKGTFTVDVGAKKG